MTNNVKNPVNRNNSYPDQKPLHPSELSYTTFLLVSGASKKIRLVGRTLLHPVLKKIFINGDYYWSDAIAEVEVLYDNAMEFAILTNVSNCDLDIKVKIVQVVMSICETSFARLVEDLLHRSDQLVRTSQEDLSSGFLIDKIIGVNGIYISEQVSGGFDGYFLKAECDLDFLDRRYLLPIEQHEIINFGLGIGVHNGYVIKQNIYCVPALIYPAGVRSKSFWSAMVSQDYVSGETNYHIRWNCEESISGIVVFSVHYQCVNPNDYIAECVEEIVSGIHDGTSKMNEIKINIPIGYINDGSQFFTDVERLGDIDTLGDVNILGVAVKYRRHLE